MECAQCLTVNQQGKTAWTVQFWVLCRRQAVKARPWHEEAGNSRLLLLTPEMHGHPRFTLYNSDFGFHHCILHCTIQPSGCKSYNKRPTYLLNHLEMPPNGKFLKDTKLSNKTTRFWPQDPACCVTLAYSTNPFKYHALKLRLHMAPSSQHLKPFNHLQ